MIGWLLIALLLLCLVVERLRAPGRFRTADTLTNVWTFAGYLLISLVWGPVLFELYSLARDHAIFDFGPHWLDVGSGRFWLSWCALFLLDDFSFYWFHRASHASPVLWAAHSTHHASTQFNLSVGLRQSWTPFVALPFWIWLPLLGFDPLMVMSMQFFSLIYQSFTHTEGVPRLGMFEIVFNTPQHHSIHHGINDAYLNKNFGGALIVWDRISRTWTGSSEPVRYDIGRSIDHPLAGLQGWFELFRKHPSTGEQ